MRAIQGDSRALADHGELPLREACGHVAGSPEIVRRHLREHDRLIACELHPEDYEALKRRYRNDPRVAVHHRDGYEAIGAFIPPKERRGIVLIDPPFEARDEGRLIAEALAAGLRKWPTGTFMAWYPIKQGEVAARLHRKLLGAGVRRLLAAELCVHPDDSRAGLNGSGIVTINPPWRFEQDLHQLLPADSLTLDYPIQ